LLLHQLNNKSEGITLLNSIVRRDLFFAFLLLVFLSNCGPKNLSKNHKALDTWIQQEARLYDIPILINAKSEKSHGYKEGSCQFIYSVQVPFEDAVQFYTQEMERFGWNSIVTFVENEALLVFEKPSKISSVSIRANKNELSILIFVKSK